MVVNFPLRRWLRVVLKFRFRRKQSFANVHFAPQLPSNAISMCARSNVSKSQVRPEARSPILYRSFYELIVATEPLAPRQDILNVPLGLGEYEALFASNPTRASPSRRICQGRSKAPMPLSATVSRRRIATFSPGNSIRNRTVFGHRWSRSGSVPARGVNSGRARSSSLGRAVHHVWHHPKGLYPVKPFVIHFQLLERRHSSDARVQNRDG